MNSPMHALFEAEKAGLDTMLIGVGFSTEVQDALTVSFFCNGSSEQAKIEMLVNAQIALTQKIGIILEHVEKEYGINAKEHLASFAKDLVLRSREGTIIHRINSLDIDKLGGGA